MGRVEWLDAIWQAALALVTGATLLELFPAGDWGFLRGRAWLSSAAAALVLGGGLLLQLAPDHRPLVLVPAGLVWLALWRFAPHRIRPRHDREWTPEGAARVVLALGCLLACKPLYEHGPSALLESLHACTLLVLLDATLRWRGADSLRRATAMAAWSAAALAFDLQAVHVWQVLPALAVAAGTVWRTRADRRAQAACVAALGLLAATQGGLALAAGIGAAFVVVTPAPSRLLFAGACAAATGAGAWLCAGEPWLVRNLESARQWLEGGTFDTTATALLGLAAFQRWRAWAGAPSEQEAPSAWADPALLVLALPVLMLVQDVWLDRTSLVWLLVWSASAGAWRVREAQA